MFVIKKDIFFNKHLKYRGFTLTEIIIIFVILGIITSISVSNTIKNIKRNEIVTRLRIAHSLLSDTISQSEKFHGNTSGWKYSNRDVWGINANAKDFANTYITPYLNVEHECIYGDNNKLCFSSGNDEIDKKYGYNSFYGISGLPIETYNGGRHSYMFKTQDDLSFAITKNSSINQTVRITVDINGPKKGRSRSGEDVFVFTLDKDNGLKAYGSKSGNGCKNGNVAPGAKGTGGAGTTCGGYIINNNWIMPKDYPTTFNPSNYSITVPCKKDTRETSYCYLRCNDRKGLEAARSGCTP